MNEICHRCQSELPAQLAGYHQNSDDAVLFCPRCSAPQLLLPEHMRIEDPGGATTGTLPPPRIRGGGVRDVDWRTALPRAAVVALVAAVLMLVGLKFNGAALLSLCWLLGGAGISLGLYARQSPRAWVDARVGIRIGVATGLLMLAAIAVAGAGTGVVMRFGTRSMASFDEQSAQQTKLAQAWGVRWLQEQNQDQAMQEKYVSFVNSPLMTSPEMKAGTELAQLGFEAMLLLLFSAGGGAFAGMLQGRRRAVLRGD